MSFTIIRTYRGAALTSGAALTLVCYALRRRGAEPWEALRVEQFAGSGGALSITRPVRIVRVALADYALPLLRQLRDGQR